MRLQFVPRHRLPCFVPLRALVLVAALGSLLGARRVAACPACNCGDPTLTAVGVEPPYAQRVRIGLEERYVHHTEGAAPLAQSLHLLRSALFVSYTPVPRITLALLLPWMTTWLRGAGTHSVISGLADLEVSARLLLFRDRQFAAHHLAWAIAGLKLPSGPELRDDAGYRYAPDEQPGSGSFDPFVGATYAWYSGGRFSAYASASYRYTSPGWQGYRRGMQLGWNAGLQLQPLRRAAFQLFTEGNWQAADRFANAAPVPSSGGLLVRLGPAVIVSMTGSLLVRAGVSIPVFHRLAGAQSEGPQVMLSLVWDVR